MFELKESKTRHWRRNHPFAQRLPSGGELAPHLSADAMIDTPPVTVGDRLLAIAAQNRAADTERCAAILTLIQDVQQLHRRLLQELDSHALTDAKLGTLVMLYSQEPAETSASSLAHHTQVTRSSMTSILDSLEDRGWIQRTRSPEDRRIINVSLTNDGRHFAEEIIRNFVGGVSTVAARLSPQEIATLTAIGARLRERSSKPRSTVASSA